MIVDALLAQTGAARLYERSDTSSRQREGLPPATGWLRGVVERRPSSSSSEHGLRFAVDVAHGHKTGFYLDQRDNRLLFADAVRRFALERVLNCYCYTGGFSWPR